MHDSYRQLFAAIAQGNAVTAETVMAKAKEENKDASAAESMRDSYQTLADALASETYKLKLEDYIKLYIGATLILKTLKSKVIALNGTIEGYEKNIIPKLKQVVDKQGSDAVAEILFNVND